jgi:hypothetical protein
MVGISDYSSYMKSCVDIEEDCVININCDG